MANKLIEGPPASVVAFARERLSARAQAALGTWRWSLDEEQRLPREELTRRLAEKGIPEWPFLLPIEEAFAGVCVRFSGFDLEIGIAHELPLYDREELLDEDGKVRFVPAGYWGIYSVFLDAEGRMFLFHEPDDLVLAEPSLESFFENEAMSFRIWAPCGFIADLSPGPAAGALAAERGVPPVAEATNEHHRWWQDAAWTLCERPGTATAMLWARTLEDLVTALDTAGRLLPDLEVRPRPPHEDKLVETVATEEVAARAPTPEALRARPLARRFTLLGAPSPYEGKPASTGDVWITGEGEDLSVDVLEHRDGALVGYWCLRAGGGRAVLASRLRSG
jgi:hypothetical protein